MTNHTNAVNPSVILPFEAVLSLKVPTTELAPVFVPSVWVSAGKFATFDEAKFACYAFADHPALIAMQVTQCFKVGSAE
ncbi:hypothetical protein FK216_01750 [Moraxellaceae bacterium AER2_44_116]|nr:hypothetical protein [Moraxellaceae bacterium]TQC99997.1 hypothetical protein FK216_01750 [Moraxellaceae bacterium AER2_44_116]